MRDYGKEKLVTAILIFVLMVGSAMAQDSEAPAEVASASAIVTFGTDIDRETRALVGETDVFAAGIERITCLTLVKGLSAPNSVTHVWYRDGKTVARVDLNVASAHWRTWSSKRLLPSWTGHWEVKVLDSDGRILGTGVFNVE